MRAVVLVLALVPTAACLLPGNRGLSMERTKMWATPGSPKAFSWVSRVEHREDTVVGTTKDNLEVDNPSSNRATRTKIYAVDPATHQEELLGEIGGAGGEPVYYDAARGVLWVRDKGELSGHAGPGRTVGPAHGHFGGTMDGLELPFVLSSRRRSDELVLYDLASDGEMDLPPGVQRGEATVDGALVRFTSLDWTGDTVRVHQIGIDWSSGKPNRLPDVTWTTPPLSPATGTRLAAAMMRDGHRFAEVIRGPAGTQLFVHDVTTSAPPVAISLPTPPPDAPPVTSGHLATLDDDAVVFGEAGPTGDRLCWRGVAVRVNRALVVPLPDKPCVLERFVGGGHRVLTILGSEVAIVDAEAQLVRLEGVHRGVLTDGIRTGPTSLAFIDERDARLAVVDVDLKTGERRSQPLAGVVRGDRLLSVSDGGARIAHGSDTILTVPIAASAAPTTLTLGAPVMTRDDRMLHDRTELWIGGGGGATTRATGVGRVSLEVAHWVTDHWTAAGRLDVRIEGAESTGKPETVDAGGSFGYTWHVLPRMWGLAVGGDLGASYAATYVDKQRTSRAFAPSAEVHLGGQGSMVGLDLSVLVPSFIDFDRGVQFLLNFKLGFTEHLR